MASEEVHVENIDWLGGVAYDPRTLRSTSIVDNIYATQRVNRELREREQSSDSIMRSELIKISIERNRRGIAHSLWSRVHQPDEGCWLWMGPRDIYGRGTLTFGGATYAVHELALSLTLDRDVDGVQQTCGRSLCCRPEHLREAVN